MPGLATIWKRHPVLGSLFLVAAAATGFFLVRAALFFLVWSDPIHHRQPVEAWMTPRYVARSWDIPREDMIGLLGLTPETVDRRRRTLEEIAADQGVSVDEIIARIEAYVAARPERRP
jgi:hypothetical protein